MLSIQAIVVLVVLVALIIALYKDALPPVVLFFIAVILLLLVGIISPKEVLHGFSNVNIAVIFLLLTISEVIKKTGLLDLAFSKFFSQKLGYHSFLLKMMLPVSGISAFLNNTPLVAIMIPYVYEWAKKKNIAPSKVMLPLSYAAILGGTATLIGTSTNLIINGLITESTNFRSLAFTDFWYVGVPLIAIGIGYITLIGSRILPNRKDALEEFQEDTRKYMVEIAVPDESEFIGKTVEEARLRRLKGLFLAEILRSDQKIAPVSPETKIRQKDRLIFAGNTNTIAELVKDNSKNLSLPKYVGEELKGEKNIVETVVATNSPLIGKKVKETDYRSKYNAAIIGIHRGGGKISGKIGSIKIKAGDLLLLITGPSFEKRAEDNLDFHIISKLKHVPDIAKWKMWVFTIGLVIALGSAAAGFISFFLALLLLLALVISLNIIQAGDLRNSNNLNLLAILALSLALGKAVDNSGAATIIAEGLISALEPLNSKIAILAGIYLLTNVMTMIITNAAAVSLVFPIAIATVHQLGIDDPRPFILALAFAGSCEFLTPFGYQTNLMVFGPGGYKFKDYFRVGIGLSLLCFITTVTILSLVYKL